MLEAGVDVLIYAGDADFVCNWMGNQAWTEALEWSGKKLYNEADTNYFEMEDGTVGGEGKSAKVSEGANDESTGRLTFLKIYDAGHLSPKDQPYATLQMLNRFIENGDIGT